jgi:hypothetical protein
MRARYAALLLLAVASCTRAPVGRGKAAYVFIATGCPIANRALPEIARVAARFAGRVDVTLVYPDDRDDEVTAHRGTYGVTLPSARDPTHKLVAAAHATVTPEAALFRDGALVWHGRIDDRYSDVAHERPAATTHDFEDAMAALAEGRTLPPAQAAVGCAIPSAGL